MTKNREKDELHLLREEIDSLDEQLLQGLAKRQKVVQRVGKLKKRTGMQALQPQRWLEVLKKNCAIGSELGLSEKYVTELWERIHQESLKIELEEKKDD